MCLFGLTVTWSIHTTAKKAIQLLSEEKKQGERRAARRAAAGEDLLSGHSSNFHTSKHSGNAHVDLNYSDVFEPMVQAETPEINAIMYEEKHHFTYQRVVFTLISFGALFVTQLLFKEDMLNETQKLILVSSFAAVMVLLTKWSVNHVMYIHTIKVRDGYRYDPNDLLFKSNGEIINLAGICMIAAMLCGMTGIAGGMVLGPLFLKYNMLPTVMSATNQYITMVASIAVVIQFWFLNKLNI